FLVGIDLGTTNTACAFVDPAAGRALRVFEVPQLVAPGEVGARPTLPSFLYLAGAHELPAGSLDPPWAAGRAWCVGLFAREQGARVPGRLVASSKSWLCHAAVDRTAAILPWGTAPEVAKVSPVEASARTLTHLREAWDASFPAPLAEQSVVLTVPASFDEVARELTLAAARAAGLPDVVMLADPTLGEVRLSVPGRGGAVIGGALAAALARAEVEATVLDRFFPRVAADTRPRPGRAPREWGLPFAEEPEITRHLAEFLARQRGAAGQADLPLARPDALLFNGGALEPEAVRERVCV